MSNSTSEAPDWHPTAGFPAASSACLNSRAVPRARHLRSTFVGFIVALVCLSALGCSLFRAPDEGGHEPELVRDAAFSGPTTAWLVTDDLGLLRTSDAGLTWEYVAPNVIGGFERVAVVSPNDGWALSTSGHVWHTSDGGASWVALPHIDLNAAGSAADLVQQLRFADSAHGFAFDPYNVWTSGDGGNTWNRTSIEIDMDHHETPVYHGAFPTFQDGWLAGDLGSLRRTGDGGRTWTPGSLDGGQQEVRSVFFSSPMVGWAAEGNALYQTTDGGQKWARQRSAPPTFYCWSIYFLDDKEGWAAGDQEETAAVAKPREAAATVLHTENGGSVWQPLWTDGSQVLFKDVYFGDREHGWLLGNDISRAGRSIPGDVLFQTSDGGRTWVKSLDYEKVQSLKSQRIN